MSKSRPGKRKVQGKLKTNVETARKVRRLAPKSGHLTECDVGPEPTPKINSANVAENNVEASQTAVSAEFVLPCRFSSTKSTFVTTLFRDVSRQLSQMVSEADVTLLLSNMRHCLSHIDAVNTEAGCGTQLSCWCKWLITAVSSQKYTWLSAAIYRTLSQLLSLNSATSGDKYRLLSPALVSTLVTAIITTEPSRSSLCCLLQMIHHHGRLCSQYKTDIQRYLLTHMESDNSSVARSAQLCLASLFCIGAPGVGGLSVRSAWSELCVCLIASVHLTLDQLFSTISETQSFEVPDVPILADLRQLNATNPAQLRYLLCCRSVSLINTITNMLSFGAQNAVSVPVSYLLDLVTRCVAVTMATDSDDSYRVEHVLLEVQTVFRTLPDLHSCCFSLLRRLISSCGRSLLMRASQINAILTSYVTRPPDGSSVAHIASRCSAVNTLSCWLLNMAGACGLHSNAGQLISALVNNVLPALSSTDRCQTRCTNGKSNRNRKRDSKKVGCDWLIEDNISTDRPMSDAARASLARVSVDALVIMVTTLGPLLAASIHQELQSFVLIQLDDRSSSNTVLTQCYSSLYQLLTALIVNCRPDCQPAYQYCNSLLSRAIVDHHYDADVRRACADAISALYLTLHPRYPALHFPYAPSPNVTEDASVIAARAFSEGNIFCNDGATGRANQQTCNGQTDDVTVELTNERPDDSSNDDVSVVNTNGQSSNDSICDVTEKPSMLLTQSETVPVGCYGNGTSDSPEERLVEAAETDVMSSGDCVTVTLESSDDEVSNIPYSPSANIQTAAIYVGSDDGDGSPPITECSPTGDDPVILAETVSNLAPDVAEMLKDFVNICPEVE